MPTVDPSPIGNYGEQFVDINGNPLSGGKLYSYDAGTTTPRATYTTVLGDVANTNPLILGSDGRVQSAGVWLEYGYAYKFVLYNSADVLQDSWDNVIGVVVGPEGASPTTTTTASYTFNASATAIAVSDSTAFAVGAYAVITDGTNRTSGTITAKATNSLTFLPFTVTPPRDSGSGTVYASGSTIAVAGAQGAQGEQGLFWRGAWNSGTAYVVDDAVSYGGNSWIAIQAGTNQTPVEGAYWTLLAGGINFLGAWSAVTAYKVDDAVSYDGSSWVCVQANTNQTPAENAYWTILAQEGATGPAANLSDNNPVALGSAGPGVGTLASRDDHVHPMPTAANVGAMALSVVTAVGDLIYASASGIIARLAPNTTTTKKWLTMTGTGSAGQAPTWEELSGITTAMISANAVTNRGYDEDTGTFSTSSTTYVDVTGVSFSITVEGGALDVWVNLGAIDTTGPYAIFAVQIDGVDYPITAGYGGAGAAYPPCSGYRQIPAATVAAGTYTVKLRMKMSGAGTGYSNKGGHAIVSLGMVEIKR